MNKFIFLCSKFSDLDNMLPVLFALLDKDPDCDAEIIWYGYSVPENASILIDYARKVHKQRVVFWSPHVVRRDRPKAEHLSPRHIMRRGKKLFFKIASGLFGKRLLAANKIVDDLISDSITKRLLSSIRQEKESCNVLFFGFSGKQILDKIAANIAHVNKLWVRLPQGVRLTVSAFKTESQIITPSATDDYLPEWADAGIDVDRHVYDNLSRVRQALGHKAVDVDNVVLLGSPRFSKDWIRHLDIAYQDHQSCFAPFNNQKKNVLFLLTPWQKNVWKEEVLRSIHVISHYDVNLVLKGFHGNTKLPPAQGEFLVDEKSPTSVLIRDADAILYITTSAALEGYIRGKEMLQLSYVHANRTIFDDNRVGLMARCRDDLHLFMNNLLKHSRFSEDTAQKNNAEKFVVDSIVGSSPMKLYADHVYDKYTSYAGNH